MRKKRILLIDDEVSFTRLLKLNLEQTQFYEVRVENGADKALSAAREFRPDLVLLDVIMPRMTGSDVARSLRADAVLNAIPIVILSAVGARKATEDRHHALDGLPHIAKPASVEELIDGIERHLPPTTMDGTSMIGSLRSEGRTPFYTQTTHGRNRYDATQDESAHC